MHAITLFLFTLFCGSVAGHTRADIRRSRRHSRLHVPRNQTNSPTSRVFSLSDMYQKEDFFNEWNFFSDVDPTHGTVQYQSKQDAINKGLAFVQPDGTTILRVDNQTTLPSGTPRNSVRISSQKAFNGGLFIADFFSMPFGCSVWPSYWSFGPNWPNSGEVDVVEGVHNAATNTYSVHSGPNCTLSTNGLPIRTKVLNTQCLSGNGQNAGCNFQDVDNSTYGQGFNAIGGGVFAHLWDDTGIRAWHFPRNAIPGDIDAKQPNPDTWPPPAAFWSTAGCDTVTHFQNHSLVMNIALCGDLGDPSYASSGCPGTCADAVANPANFDDAKFAINYIAVYQ